VITNSAHFWIMYRRGRLISTGVADTPRIPVSEAHLSQNYPNPFNSETSIRFSLGGSKSGHVSLVVQDILGREVVRLVDQSMEPGVHEARWETGNFSSGIYLCRLTTSGKSVLRKMVLLR